MYFYDIYILSLSGVSLRGHAFCRQENLFGDCLVSAAFMSYAGPFGAAYRNELVNDEWMASVKEKDRSSRDSI